MISKHSQGSPDPPPELRDDRVGLRALGAIGLCSVVAGAAAVFLSHDGAATLGLVVGGSLLALVGLGGLNQFRFSGKIAGQELALGWAQTVVQAADQSSEPPEARRGQVALGLRTAAAHGPLTPELAEYRNEAEYGLMVDAAIERIDLHHITTYYPAFFRELGLGDFRPDKVIASPKATVVIEYRLGPPSIGDVDRLKAIASVAQANEKDRKWVTALVCSSEPPASVLQAMTSSGISHIRWQTPADDEQLRHQLMLSLGGAA